MDINFIIIIINSMTDISMTIVIIVDDIEYENHVTHVIYIYTL